jgi:predicted Zn finger-like uncharacterized protein
MDVRCERCRAQYLFDDDQVTPTGLTVQCTNCGYVFRVKKKELVVTLPVKPDEVQGSPLPANAVAPRAGGARAAPWPLTPLPLPAAPVYGGAQQSAPYLPVPPPPSGFPPPSFAVATPPPRPPAAPPPQAVPLPVHEVDLGPDVEVPQRRRGRGRVWALALVLVASAGAAVYVNLPRLLARPKPAPVPVPVTVQAQPEKKPEPPPEPPPPPLPVVAPEPVTEPALQAAPVPVEKPKAPPRSTKAILAQAHRLLEKGDAQAALELFGRVASDDPENADALTGRGLCYLDLENYAPAEASFEAALRIDPDQPDALLGLAETCRSRGKKSEAVSHYEKYLARHPDGEEAEVARNALAELRK